MLYVRCLLLSLLCLALSACFQAQLVGSVGEATLTVAPLRTPTDVVIETSTFTEEDWIATLGSKTWEGYSELARALFVGIVNPGRKQLDTETLYLVSAIGGTDVDSSASGALGNETTPVQGRWHTVVPGERIRRGNIKVSALTEAVYRMIARDMALYSDAELELKLDAAAQLLVDDVDGDGAVDYDDVLRWNRGLDSGKLRVSLADLDTLASRVHSGAPADLLDSQAEAVFGRDRVRMVTNFGTLEMELHNWESPITVANFLDYVNSGYYDQVLFHRVVQGFVIQGGWLQLVGENQAVRKDPGDNILNESRNGLSNTRGSVAMARTSAPHSANAQFFINQVDNDFLDHDGDEGYAVFATVTEGMEVVDTIAAEPVRAISGVGNSVPVNAVVIESITLLEE